MGKKGVKLTRAQKTKLWTAAIKSNKTPLHLKKALRARLRAMGVRV